MSNNNCFPQKPPNPSICIISPKVFDSLVPDISFCSESGKDDFTSKQSTLSYNMRNFRGELKPTDSRTEQLGNWKLPTPPAKEKSLQPEINSGSSHSLNSRLDLARNSFLEQHKSKPKDMVIDESASVGPFHNYLNNNIQNKQHSRSAEVCKTAIKCRCCIASSRSNFNQSIKINQPCQDFIPIRAQEASNKNLDQSCSEISKYPIPIPNLCHLSHGVTYQQEISDNNIQFQADSKCNDDDTVKQMQILMNRYDEIFEFVKSLDKKIDVMQGQVSFLLNEHSKLKNNNLIAQNSSRISNFDQMSPSAYERDSISDISHWERLENRMESQLEGLFKLQTQHIKKLQKQVTMLQNSENCKMKCDSSETASMTAINSNLGSIRKKSFESPSSMDNSSNDSSEARSKTCSIGTMTNLAGIKDTEISKSKKIRSSKQNHDPRLKPIEKKSVDADNISENSPKSNLEENCDRRITSKNKPFCNEEIQGEKCNSNSGLNETKSFSIDYEDDSDSTLSNESGAYRKCSREKKKLHGHEPSEIVSEDFCEKVVGKIDGIISNQTQSPTMPKSYKPISPPRKSNKLLRLNRCNQENQNANKTSLHNTVVSKHLSKMSNNSVDMSYEFRRMQAKYFGENDVLEVHTSCTVTRNNFSQGTLEYLQSQGLLRNSSKTNVKSAKK